MAEQLTATLQENTLTLLAHSDEHGKIVANMIDPSLFEGDYRLIAERCVEYWKQQGEAPKAHTPDLIADIIEDADNKRAATFRRILAAMFELSASINSRYVLQQLQQFTRLQRLKAGILKSAEQLNSKQEMAIGEVEAIWNDLLRVREQNFDPGMRLDDIDRVMEYFQTVQDEFDTGIPDFDKRHIVPLRNAMMLILGATGRGKTWMLVHLGKRALMQRKKVVHLTLEMIEEDVVGRYYQSLFAVPKRDLRATISTIEKDRFGRLTEMGREDIRANFAFTSPMVRDELFQRLDFGGRKFQNLIVKYFRHPPTINEIEAYLENLEALEGFIPDLIILDYLGLCKIDMRNPRLSLGATAKDFRSLCIRRQAAGVAAQQVSKEGARSRLVQHYHVAEDWSLTNTADSILTISATEAEMKLGLARSYVSKMRGEKAALGVLITNNYQMGQFHLQSALLSDKYYDYLDSMKEEYEDEGQYEDEDPDNDED